MRRVALGLLVAAVILVGCAGLWLRIFSLNPTEAAWVPPLRGATADVVRPRQSCESRHELRQAYFGDLHVHSGFSMDARTRDLTLSPDEAYRYARGEVVRLPPLAADGMGTRPVRIDRPLDFAAVTDHAEWMGEVRLCTDPTSDRFGLRPCKIFRGEESHWFARLIGAKGMFGRILGLIGRNGRLSEICGDDAATCRRALLSVWQETQDAAERWYDRSSACEFTTFPGYEYSASPNRSKVHRNVIFRNEVVPELPISWIDAATPERFWKLLSGSCLPHLSTCEVLAIPHNPNLSNGRMFTYEFAHRPILHQRNLAKLRRRLEPIVEMMQVKGESECRDGMFGVIGDADEFCDFEKVRTLRGDDPDDCELSTGSGALAGRGCESRLDYVRYALIEGLRLFESLDLNPYGFGFIGSTDNHNASPGAVTEYDWPGAIAAADATVEQRLESNGRQVLARNPGGLAGVWAEENSRDALFDALQRRETFATSGTRIRPRFFGGWDYPSDICIRGDLVAVGYQEGVPMGGELVPRPSDTDTPVFVVEALRDPGTDAHAGGLLQRVQIIKGTFTDAGEFKQEIYDVAGRDLNASVDLSTCEPSGEGNEQLCGFWRDPDFDPYRPAVYYARVLENPSCRWSWRQCSAMPEAERPPGCSAEDVPKVIQERAWTSPIWYYPPT